jgi:uncharacterized protein YycO
MIRLVFFKSKGFISKAIQWQTRSPYSHVAIQLDNVMYESYHVGGVRKDRKPEAGCEIYELTCAVNEDAVRGFLESKLGMKYDFIMVARFLTRRSATENNKWFCSELVMAAIEAAGVKLLNAEPHNVSPRDLFMTPYIDVKPVS